MAAPVAVPAASVGVINLISNTENLEAPSQVGADLARDGDRAREDVDLRAVGARHLTHQ